jgi:hypothetical protein
MSISKIRLYPQQLLLSLAVVCGALSIVNPDSVSAQTTSVVRILRVKPNFSTTFKRRENWYQQSKDITSDEKCSVPQGTKFFVSSIRRQIQNAPARPKGNTERLADYWEVTFEKPLPCQQEGDNNQTWFIYKQHVEELKGVLVP